MPLDGAVSKRLYDARGTSPLRGRRCLSTEPLAMTEPLAKGATPATAVHFEGSVRRGRACRAAAAPDPADPAAAAHLGFRVGRGERGAAATETAAEPRAAGWRGFAEEEVAGAGSAAGCAGTGPSRRRRCGHAC